MNRRRFLSVVAVAPVVGRALFSPALFATEPSSAPSTSVGPPRRRFEITTRVTLPEDSGAAQLWLPLAQTAGDYQTALDLRWQTNGKTARVRDDRYGAPVLWISWDAAVSGIRQVETVQTVATCDRGPTPMLPLTEAERRFWTAPTASAPTDGIVFEKAARITAGKTSQSAQLRAIYDWVVDHTYRDPDIPGCGTGNFLKGLESGKLGGKCADINSLLVGLARAAGFPAREVYGLRVAKSRIYPSLGREGDISKAQHCRAEVFLNDEGWFPLDPADVRKAVLEQKITLDSPEGRALRDQMFGHWEMNWIGYNSATGIEFPGDGRHRPDFDFLMYPCALTEKGQAPCLDPAHFQYEISSREATV